MTPSQKLAIVTELFEAHAVITCTKDICGTEITKTGIIDHQPEPCSGIWGYGGDSIAVYIAGEPFPSEDVISQNQVFVI